MWQHPGSPYIYSYTIFNLLWEKQDVNRILYELISPYTPPFLLHSFSFQALRRKWMSSVKCSISFNAPTAWCDKKSSFSARILVNDLMYFSGSDNHRAWFALRHSKCWIKRFCLAELSWPPWCSETSLPSNMADLTLLEWVKWFFFLSRNFI